MNISVSDRFAVREDVFAVDSKNAMMSCTVPTSLGCTIVKELNAIGEILGSAVPNGFERFRDILEYSVTGVG